MADFDDKDEEFITPPVNEWVLSREDFVSEEAMHKYFRDNETAPRIAYESYLAENDLPEEEERTRTATAKPVYTLTGLPTGNVVQAIYVWNRLSLC